MFSPTLLTRACPAVQRKSRLLGLARVRPSWALYLPERRARSSPKGRAKERQKFQHNILVRGKRKIDPRSTQVTAAEGRAHALLGLKVVMVERLLGVSSAHVRVLVACPGSEEVANFTSAPVYLAYAGSIYDAKSSDA